MLEGDLPGKYEEALLETSLAESLLLCLSLTVSFVGVARPPAWLLAKALAPSMVLILLRTSARVDLRHIISSVCSWTFFSKSATLSRRLWFSFSIISSADELEAAEDPGETGAPFSPSILILLNRTDPDEANPVSVMHFTSRNRSILSLKC